MFRSISRAAPALIFLAASLGACQKAEVAPRVPEPTICFPPTPATAAAQLVGRWELIESVNGMSGGIYPADPARKQEIVFTAAGQASFLLNGVVTRTGPFSVVQATSYLTRKPETFVNFDPASATRPLPFIERLSASELKLVIDANDGGGSRYVRR